MSDKKIIRKKKKLGSYPYITVVFSISLALFVLGLFGVMLIHVNKISDNLKNSFEVHIYLNDNLTQGQISQFQNLLSSKKFIASTNGQKDIIFVSKEEAAKKFISKNNENFIDVLGYNPLKNAFRIKIAPNFTDEANIKKLKAQITELNGVFEVEMVESLIHEINRNMRRIGVILIAFSLILIFIIFILINNTIKLALFSQRFLIRSMQLVGATTTFIQLPYIKRAVWQGALASIISSIGLYALLQYSYQQFEELKLIQDMNSFVLLIVGLLVFGILIGLISSFLAVRKYTKMSLDDLY